MSLFARTSRTRTGTVSARRTRRALARAVASAPTAESRHELLALSTRL